MIQAFSQTMILLLAHPADDVSGQSSCLPVMATSARLHLPVLIRPWRLHSAIIARHTREYRTVVPLIPALRAQAGVVGLPVWRGPPAASSAQQAAVPKLQRA